MFGNGPARREISNAICNDRENIASKICNQMQAAHEIATLKKDDCGCYVLEAQMAA
jgi:hypothetical protein